MRHLFSLNPYIWKYRRHFLLGILFVTASNLFAVYPAQVVRGAMDMVAEMIQIYSWVEGSPSEAGLREQLMASLLFFGLLVCLMAILRGIFLFFTRQTLIVMSRWIEYDIRKDLYDHFQRMTLLFYRRNRTGDLMARIAEDVGRVRTYLGPGIMYSVNMFTTLVVVLTTMFAVNWELTLYALLPLPLLALLIYRVESVIQKRSEVIQEQLSALTTFTQEIYSGIRVVKAYVRERASSLRFTRESESYKEKSMHLARIDAIFFPLVTLLVGMSVLLTVWVGGGKVIAGALTLGNIAEFILYINLLTWPIIALGWVTTLIQRAAASQKRLDELFEVRPEIRFPESGPRPRKAHVELEEVSFTYPDTGIRAVRDISFEVRPGQKIGIIGPTGSGKSTLCALLPRLLDPDAGELRFDGHPLPSLTQESLRSIIGYAPQDVFLFSDSIRENIAFGSPGASFEAVSEAARRAVIHDNILDFPEGYETVVGERGVTLSGGQKQRISIARAWIRQPQLLILDDVLSAVDTRTEEEILSHLRAYRQAHPETAVVVVAHRITCLQDSDLILVLENGRISDRGTHEELIAREGYYARIYRKQLLEGVNAE